MSKTLTSDALKLLLQIEEEFKRDSKQFSEFMYSPETVFAYPTYYKTSKFENELQIRNEIVIRPCSLILTMELQNERGRVLSVKSSSNIPQAYEGGNKVLLAEHTPDLYVFSSEGGKTLNISTGRTAYSEVQKEYTFRDIFSEEEAFQYSLVCGEYDDHLTCARIAYEYHQNRKNKGKYLVVEDVCRSLRKETVELSVQTARTVLP